MLPEKYPRSLATIARTKRSFKKIVYGMIVVAKLSLFIIWLMAFVVTCLVIGVTFPVIVLFDKFQMHCKEVSL